MLGLSEEMASEEIVDGTKKEGALSENFGRLLERTSILFQDSFHLLNEEGKQISAKMHPFGSVNISKQWGEFHELIEKMRNVIHLHKKLTTDCDESAINRYLNSLKDLENVGQTLRQNKKSLEQCLVMLEKAAGERHSQREDSPLLFLQQMVQEFALHYDVDSPSDKETSEFLIWTGSFILYVIISKTNGEVVEVRTELSPSEFREDIVRQSMDEELTDLLKNGDYQAFKTKVKHLKELDSLISKYSLSLRTLKSSEDKLFHFISERKQQAPGVFLEPHRSCDGIHVFYFSLYHQLPHLQSQSSSSSKYHLLYQHAKSIFFSQEEGSVFDDHGQVIGPDNSNTTFVMNFSPPVVMSIETLNSIISLCSPLRKLKSLQPSDFRFISNEKLLIERKREENEQLSSSASSHASHSTSCEGDHSLSHGSFDNDDRPVNKVTVNGAEHCYIFAGEGNQGCVVHRIPFSFSSDDISSPHLMENIFQIILMVQQQEMFNCLFESCFSSQLEHELASAERRKSQTVEVMSNNAAHYLQVVVVHPVSGNLCSLQIAIAPGGVLNVNFDGAEDDIMPSPGLVTQLLTNCLSIPLTLAYIWDEI
eukprot:TRINITY_DN2488_c0_g1_i1.p1 TRINITY_DN2488_c0_g1~~TRINITY_DN2488_c0_g1_i1.p1  ORF type:complete len:593 (+),score=105.48 TRINITY_DN2488_c0_g1_i1:67-1845(+)